MNTSSSDLVLVDEHLNGRVAVLTLNRPEAT